MTWGDRYRALGRNPMVRTALFILGCTLVAITPLVSAIPGPGGVFVFAAGATLMLRYSRWAKRRYVRFKRWQPKAGEWSDWSLRRESYRRRRALREAAPTLTPQNLTDEPPCVIRAPHAAEPGSRGL